MVEKALVGSTVVMALFTPEFVGSEKCLKRFALRTTWWSSFVVPVFCGVSREQVVQKMVSLFSKFTQVPLLPEFSLSINSK